MTEKVEESGGVEKKGGLRKLGGRAFLLAILTLGGGATTAVADDIRINPEAKRQLRASIEQDERDIRLVQAEIKEIDARIEARMQKLADFYQKAYREQHNIFLTDEQARTLAKKKLSI